MDIVCSGRGNRSCVRALLACALAKSHQPALDIRKPYTKIGADDAYPIEPSVSNYAAKAYARSGGVEVVVLDCVSFLRHFLHLFYRLRVAFLDVYQQLVLGEPDNVIRPALKEALLLLRAAAEQAAR